MQYSTKYFRVLAGDPAAYDPDIPVVRTMADLLAGRDAVLEAAMSIPNPNPESPIPNRQPSADSGKRKAAVIGS